MGATGGGSVGRGKGAAGSAGSAGAPTDTGTDDMSGCGRAVSNRAPDSALLVMLLFRALAETASRASSFSALSPAAVPRRCFWAASDELLAAYHDAEWGVPIHDDRRWYEKLLLDGAQAGLSWLTILKKREGYREAFADFDPARVARFTERDVERLMQNDRIVRNRLKIRSAITNARAFLALQQAEGSFDAWVWKFIGGKPVRGRVKGRGDIPARTPLSDALSKELRARGFSFVGSTIVYAFMQAGGLVNDHAVGCFRGRQVEALALAPARRSPARAQRSGRSPRPPG